MASCGITLLLASSTLLTVIEYFINPSIKKMETIGEGCRRKIIRHLSFVGANVMLRHAIETHSYGTLKILLEIVDLDLTSDISQSIINDPKYEDTLSWLIQGGYVDRRNTAICNWAAFNEDISILKRLRFLGFAWDMDTCHIAARKGYAEHVIWLIENGCPWNGATYALVIKENLAVPLEIFETPENCRGALKF